MQNLMANRTICQYKSHRNRRGGNNTINRMIDTGLKGVEFISINTDAQALYVSRQKCKSAKSLLKGRAGANPEIGQLLKKQSQLEDVLKGADMIFVTAGMVGSRTGCAYYCGGFKELGILTVGVVTKPFA